MGSSHQVRKEGQSNTHSSDLMVPLASSASRRSSALCRSTLQDCMLRTCQTRQGIFSTVQTQGGDQGTADRCTCSGPADCSTRSSHPAVGSGRVGPPRARCGALTYSTAQYSTAQHSTAHVTYTYVRTYRVFIAENAVSDHHALHALAMTRVAALSLYLPARTWTSETRANAHAPHRTLSTQPLRTI